MPQLNKTVFQWPSVLQLYPTSFRFGFEHFCPVGIYVLIKIPRPVKNFPPSADAGGLGILEKAEWKPVSTASNFSWAFPTSNRQTRLKAYPYVLWASCKEAHVSCDGSANFQLRTLKPFLASNDKRTFAMLKTVNRNKASSNWSILIPSRNQKYQPSKTITVHTMWHIPVSQYNK